MAPSMAAALAASLPTPSTTPATPQPKYEAIPASMAKVIDIEAEIPVTAVQLEGMVSYSSLGTLFIIPIVGFPEGKMLSTTHRSSLKSLNMRARHPLRPPTDCYWA
jgi:hypothetical protein